MLKRNISGYSKSRRISLSLETFASVPIKSRRPLAFHPYHTGRKINGRRFKLIFFSSSGVCTSTWMYVSLCFILLKFIKLFLIYSISVSPNEQDYQSKLKKCNDSFFGCCFSNGYLNVFCFEKLHWQGFPSYKDLLNI